MRSNAAEQAQRRQDLQRLFSTFPGGWPGVGLLLLRAAAGIATAIQGGVYLVESTAPRFEIGLLLAVSGFSFLIGFLTPAASALVALSTMGIAPSWFPIPTPNFFNTPLPAVLIIIIAVAVAFVGPGALSVDCRLFGRREIIIPQVPLPPES